MSGSHFCMSCEAKDSLPSVLDCFFTDVCTANSPGRQRICFFLKQRTVLNGRQNKISTFKDVHVFIPETFEFVTSWGKWVMGKMRINVADRIKNANKLKDLKIRRLSWIIKVGEM